LVRNPQFCWLTGAKEWKLNGMLEIHVEEAAPQLSARTLKRDINLCIRDLQIEKLEISITLVSDITIKKLNREYRKKNKATDVLSFAMREGEFPEFGAAILGDIVVSVETAGRQAAEKGKAIQEEVTFLVIHGLLHLLGYDHQTDAQERKMNRESARLSALTSKASPKPRRSPVKKVSLARRKLG
jgi:probable rRNA maturation factor